MTILIGRYAGHVTLNSSATDRIIAVTNAEWANFIERIKSGQLDYTLQPIKADTRAMPNGTERPGEHWNARLIREDAERQKAAQAEVEHWGDGAGGIGQAVHKGPRVDCPAPECGR